MRAVFTITLAETNSGYPPDSELIELFKKFGWDINQIDNYTEQDIIKIIGDVPSPATDADVAVSENRPRYSDIEARQKANFIRLASPVFRLMPEVAGAERGSIIYFGYIAGEQTLFIVTRVVDGEITFRLLHRQLGRLQRATSSILYKIIHTRTSSSPLTISAPTVNIYERQFDEVIIVGRIITSPAREIMRNSWRETIISSITFSLFIISFPPFYQEIIVNKTYLSWVERFNTAMFTSSLVIFLGLLSAYFELKRRRLIDWSVNAVDIQLPPIVRRFSR